MLYTCTLSQIASALFLLISGSLVTAFSENAFAQQPGHQAEFVTASASVLYEGNYTWVVYSSTSLTEALQQHKAWRTYGYDSEVLTGNVKRQTYYRVIVGQFDSLSKASTAQKQMGDILPLDTWLLRLTIDMQMIPESQWLSIEAETPADTLASLNGESILELETDSSERVTRSSEDNSGQLHSDEDVEQDPIPNEEDDPVFPLESFWSRHVRAEVHFSSVYEDNIDHSEPFEAIQSYGIIPALSLQFVSSPSDPLFTLEYIVARHNYSNTDRWDRISNSFRGVYQPRISDVFHLQTSIEIALKGSSEDRDISNQYQFLQEVEYRFTRRHRLQLYGTWRHKYFDDRDDPWTFKPNVGLNFERTNSDGERFESGTRYEINRREVARGNYRRWTFSVEYRSPLLWERDQFEIEIKHRRKFYQERFVEIEDEDFLRQDTRLGIGLVWAHRFGRGVVLELGYEYETRGSNDPEKLYEANAFNFLMVYEL